MKDINSAVIVIKQAASFAGTGNPERPNYLTNLGIAYWSRFERTKSENDLNRAIAANEQALALLPKSHPDLPAFHNNLGIQLQTRFKSTRNNRRC
jgi:hypothetical protein